MNDLLKPLADVNALELALIENGGVLSPELELQFCSVNLDHAESVDAVSEALTRLEAVTKYWAERASESQRVAKAMKLAHEKLEEHVKELMRQSDKTDLFGVGIRLKLQRTAPALILPDIDLLPDEFKKTVTEIVADKDKIRAELDRGEDIPGCSYKVKGSLRPYVNRRGA